MLPLLLVAALALLQVAVLGADHVAAQSLAAQLARTAAVSGPEAARHAVARTLPAPAHLDVRRVRQPGDTAPWYLVELRVPSRAFHGLGLRRDVVGRAAARAE